MFLQEVIAFNVILPGAFPYSDLQELYFDDYEYLKKEVERIGKIKANGK